MNSICFCSRSVIRLCLILACFLWFESIVLLISGMTHPRLTLLVAVNEAAAASAIRNNLGHAEKTLSKTKQQESLQEKENNYGQ